MHSSFSHDSGTAPEEMIRGAIGKGLEMICFTDHFDKDDMEWGEESHLDPEMYFRTLRAPVRRNTGIRSTSGSAWSWDCGLTWEIITGNLCRRYPFDFVIGSVHSVDVLGSGHREAFCKPGRTTEAYRQAFAETLEDIRAFQDFDVLGHLDYVVRYGKNRERDYSGMNGSPRRSMRSCVF